jgi:hypothetical protein
MEESVMDKVKVVVDVRGDIRRLHLGPGDVLVVNLHNVHTQDRFVQIKEQLDVVMEKVGFKDRYIVIAGEQVELTVAGRAT